MFSLAFDPRYERNHRFFVNYVGRDGNVHIASFRTRKGFAVPRSHRNILTVPTINKDPYSHYGGALVFGPDGRLYASFGDSGDGSSSQSDSTLLGKLVRIDVAHPGKDPVVVAYGLRNPWRYSFDRATGVIYIGDAGGDLREEVNRLPKKLRGKANFGWDIYEGNIRRSPVPDAAAGRLGQAVRRIPPPAEEVQLGHRRIRLQRKRESPLCAADMSTATFVAAYGVSSCGMEKLSSEDADPSTRPISSPRSARDRR